MHLVFMYLLGILAAVRKQKSNPNRTNPESDKSNCYSLPDRPITVVSIPPTPTDQERAEKKKQNRRDSIKFWIEIAGLIVLAVYTGFTAMMYSANKKAADAARDAAIEAKRSREQAEQSVHLDQRAWVTIHDVSPSDEAKSPWEIS